MGTVDERLPVLMVLPKLWVAGPGTLDMRQWLTEWREWQTCGVCLPLALHRAAAYADSEFADDYGGKLGVYFARVHREWLDILGKPVDVRPPTHRAPLVGAITRPERLYGHIVGIDPADALHVVLIAEAAKLEKAGKVEQLNHYTAGASLAGMCSGSLDDAYIGDELTIPRGSFAWVWRRIVQPDLNAPMFDGADDTILPEWPSQVPFFLTDYQSKHPELFK